MRFHITMTNGTVWQTNFEQGRELGTDDWDVLSDHLHIIATGSDGVDAYVSLNPDHVVSTVDMDCG